MRCDELSALIDVYLDGELAEVDAAELEAHAGACAACGRTLERQVAFRGALHGLAQEHHLDDAFHARLAGQLARAVAPRRHHEVVWPRVAAAAFVVAGLSGVLVSLSARPPVSAETRPLDAVSSVGEVVPDYVDDSVRWHSRPLPVEVTGPDGAEVGNWFRGKVDFPVAPPNFSRRAHLLGGRLGNVQENEAALLVYDVDGRKLSVMMFDATGALLPTAHTPSGREVPFMVQGRNGFNVAVHQRDGVAYTFTTDLPGSELQDLVAAAFRY